MKLVPGSSGWVCVMGKAGVSKMELGLEIALWKVRNHSYRGVNPAYELTELTLATGSGESCEPG